MYLNAQAERGERAGVRTRARRDGGHDRERVRPEDGTGEQALGGAAAVRGEEPFGEGGLFIITPPL